MTAPYLLSSENKTEFPDINLALEEPDGLLAFGGDLSIKRLHAAYQQGIFPWYSQGQPILWWSPDPRMVLYPAELKVSRSLRKKIRQKNYTISFDQEFKRVIQHCSEPRLQQKETWILNEMIEAYCEFNQAGFAHSVEYWQDGELLGGLYGITIGQAFFGESMFSRVSDSSKIAFVFLTLQLKRWGFKFIDCQVYSSHLESLGAKMIARKDFKDMLIKYTVMENLPEQWVADADLLDYVLKGLV